MNKAVNIMMMVRWCTSALSLYDDDDNFDDRVLNDNVNSRKNKL